MAKKSRFRGLRVVASILANATAILSANYIVFYILDHYNPGLHFVIHSDFPLGAYLHWFVAVTAVLSGLLYLLLFSIGAYDRYSFSGKRLAIILIVDVLIAGAIAMAINTNAFDWLGLRQVKAEDVRAVATLPPTITAAPTVAPTDTPAPSDTPVPTSDQASSDAQTEPTDTPAPTEAPTATPEPTATPIPGLLGSKFAEKFTDGEPVSSEPNTAETLEDGTVKTLLYTYGSDKVAIEVYHFQKGKLEYQFADIYVRELKSLMADYTFTNSGKDYVPGFAKKLGAIAAINTDYFINNGLHEGLIIRNGNLLKDNSCKNADLCVIYQDGTMRCFDCKKDTIDNNEIINSFPYHSFYFGPSLLDENGGVKTAGFNMPDSIGAANPRTVIGYYEPGHYGFLCVLGARGVRDINNRNGNSQSPGLKLDELSQLCHDLGFVCAYNLDGGGSSSLYWNNQLFGHNTRDTSDILAVIDPR